MMEKREKEEIKNRLELEITSGGFGRDSRTFKTNIGTFNTWRKEFLDYYGNPVYVIEPQGYVNELIKINGYRRSHKNQWWTTQSYNIEEDMFLFLAKLEKEISKGKKLYHN